MTPFDDFLNRKRQQHGDKFDPSLLAAKFVPYYNSGQRVVVRFGEEYKRGTIGVTTGWRPVFILLLTKRSRGSSWVLSKYEEIIGSVSRPKVTT